MKGVVEMKKWIVAVGLTFMVGLVHAKTPNFDDWRSTETCTADASILVATGPIYLADLVVTSAAATGITSFTYFNSSATNIHLSTSVYYDTNLTGDSFSLGETLKYGFSYTTTGTSCIRVRWNWMQGYNPGQQSRGVK